MLLHLRAALRLLICFLVLTQAFVSTQKVNGWLQAMLSTKAGKEAFTASKANDKLKRRYHNMRTAMLKSKKTPAGMSRCNADPALPSMHAPIAHASDPAPSLQQLRVMRTAVGVAIDGDIATAAPSEATTENGSSNDGTGADGSAAAETNAPASD